MIGQANLLLLQQILWFSIGRKGQLVVSKNRKEFVFKCRNVEF